MKTKNNLKELSRDKVVQLKSFIEEMELQLALGKAEAVEELENQKKNLRNFILENKKIIHDTDLNGKNNDLKTFFEDLQLQLSLVKSESREVPEEQWHFIVQKINVLQEFINNSIKTINNEHETFFDSFGFKTDKLKAIVEMSRMELALGKADLKDEVDQLKKEFHNKLQNLKFQLNDEVEIVEDKFNDISLELKNSFNGFMSGIKGK